MNIVNLTEEQAMIYMHAILEVTDQLISGLRTSFTVHYVLRLTPVVTKYVESVELTIMFRRSTPERLRKRSRTPRRCRELLEACSAPCTLTPL